MKFFKHLLLGSLMGLLPFHEGFAASLPKTEETSLEKSQGDLNPAQAVPMYSGAGVYPDDNYAKNKINLMIRAGYAHSSADSVAFDGVVGYDLGLAAGYQFLPWLSAKAFIDYYVLTTLFYSDSIQIYGLQVDYAFNPTDRLQYRLGLKGGRFTADAGGIFSTNHFSSFALGPTLTLEYLTSESIGIGGSLDLMWVASTTAPQVKTVFANPQDVKVNAFLLSSLNFFVGFHF